MPVLLDQPTEVVDRRGASLIAALFAGVVVVALVLFLALHDSGTKGSGGGQPGVTSSQAPDGSSEKSSSDSSSSDSSSSDSSSDATSGGSTGQSSGDQPSAGASP